MEIQLRKAKSSDSQIAYEWRNHPITRSYSHNSNLINFDDHIKWFENTINSTSHCLLIAETEQEAPIGVLRYDFTQNEALVSIYICPDLHGKGLGTKILTVGTDYIRKEFPLIKKLKAQIHDKNIGSRRAFEKSGFKFIASNSYGLNL